MTIDEIADIYPGECRPLCRTRAGEPRLFPPPQTTEQTRRLWFVAEAASKLFMGERIPANAIFDPHGAIDELAALGEALDDLYAEAEQ